MAALQVAAFDHNHDYGIYSGLKNAVIGAYVPTHMVVASVGATMGTERAANPPLSILKRLDRSHTSGGCRCIFA